MFADPSLTWIPDARKAYLISGLESGNWISLFRRLTKRVRSDIPKSLQNIRALLNY